ncbi:hypothetical protein [Roseiarcus sp.]|uniref:hypothetical protein n=1 Tax=Roseiarcus sp. TaxID=1969460 RepID=UPI003F9BE9E5
MSKRLQVETDRALARYEAAKAAGDTRATDAARLELRTLAAELVKVRDDAIVFAEIRKALNHPRRI